MLNTAPIPITARTAPSACYNYRDYCVCYFLFSFLRFYFAWLLAKELYVTMRLLRSRNRRRNRRIHLFPVQDRRMK